LAKERRSPNRRIPKEALQRAPLLSGKSLPPGGRSTVIEASDASCYTRLSQQKEKHRQKRHEESPSQRKNRLLTLILSSIEEARKGDVGSQRSAVLVASFLLALLKKGED
jgi:hypothetical protein